MCVCVCVCFTIFFLSKHVCTHFPKWYLFTLLKMILLFFWRLEFVIFSNCCKHFNCPLSPGIVRVCNKYRKKADQFQEFILKPTRVKDSKNLPLCLQNIQAVFIYINHLQIRYGSKSGTWDICLYIHTHTHIYIYIYELSLTQCHLDGTPS